MSLYRIIVLSTGIDLGTYTGATASEALDEMARDAGYRSYREIPGEVAADQGDLLVEAVTE